MTNRVTNFHFLFWQLLSSRFQQQRLLDNNADAANVIKLIAENTRSSFVLQEIRQTKWNLLHFSEWQGLHDL